MSEKPKMKNVSWDEEAIAEDDKLRGTRQKILEPDTPFAFSPISLSSASSECDEAKNRAMDPFFTSTLNKKLEAHAMTKGPSFGPLQVEEKDTRRSILPDSDRDVIRRALAEGYRDFED